MIDRAFCAFIIQRKVYKFMNKISRRYKSFIYVWTYWRICAILFMCVILTGKAVYHER